MKALDRFGREFQIGKFTGEVGELLDAIQKYKEGRANKHDVAEEIADVRIMLEQLDEIFDVAGERDRVMNLKLTKLRKKLMA